MTHEYGLIFEDNELDKKVTSILDNINDEVSDEHTLVDVSNFEEDGITIYVVFNSYNCDDEDKIKTSTTNIVKKLGHNIVWDDYPDVDECGTSYSYDAFISFE